MRTVSNKIHSAGLTLIEMMIVIAIVAIVSGVIMFNYSGFTTNVSVRNLAQDIALSIRKAQSYATSVQTLSSGGSTTSYPAYGIAFSLASSSPNVATPSQKQFVLFADVNGDGQYNAGTTCSSPSSGNECIEGFTISGSDTITQICYSTDGSSSNCTAQSVVMEFCRPAPDAAIYTNGSDVNCRNSTSYADIVVRSAKGLTQTIRLWNTGQISVQ